MRVHRRHRGQAVTELVVALSVFVVMLLVGIHLAEVGIIALKAQDAQTFATFELTQNPLRSIAGEGADSLSSAVASAQGNAQARFEDLNGLESVTKQNIITMAVTEVSGLTVTCNDVAGNFRPTATAARASQIFFDAAASCTSKVTVKPIRMPFHFLERATGDGQYGNDFHSPAEFTLCGSGTASGTNCQGGLRLLLNDWALVNEETNSDGHDAKDGPHTYKNLVGSLYAASGGAAQAFAEQFAGPPGSTASDFQFSYLGVEKQMTDTVADEQGYTRWHTGGGGAPNGMVTKTNTGHRCFLGKPGCGQ